MINLFKCSSEELKKAEIYSLEKRNAQLAEYEKAYNSVKASAKEKESSFCWQKSRLGKPKFIFHNRVVTPLLVAYEKAVESLVAANPGTSDLPQIKPIDTGKIEESFLKLKIEDTGPDFNMQRKQSQSVKLKRSYMEMQKIDSSLESLIPLNLLYALFTYLDFESFKFINPQCIIIGKFATVLYEVRK